VTLKTIQVVSVPTKDIVDWESFHDVFQERFRFAAYYGRNMNAWIDLMTYLDAPGQVDALSVDPGVIVGLQLDDAADFASRAPDLYAATIECVAFVNDRRRRAGGEPLLALVISGHFEHRPEPETTRN
jgi:hypothetical protein